MTALEEQPYNAEADLQRLLAEHPALLAGEQMNSGTPRRWLLLGRESAMTCEDAAPWYVDHLFVDQEGVPTLVEVKRSSDARIRREVVGQMLDYAAAATERWSMEELRARFRQLPDADARLAEFLGPDGDEELFWKTIETNLQARRIRMVFVADRIRRNCGRWSSSWQRSSRAPRSSRSRSRSIAEERRRPWYHVSCPHPFARRLRGRGGSGTRTRSSRRCASADRSALPRPEGCSDGRSRT